MDHDLKEVFKGLVTDLVTNIPFTPQKELIIDTISSRYLSITAASANHREYDSGYIQLLTVDSLNQLKSTKTYNLKYNLRRLMEELCDSALTVGAAMSNHWIATFIALRACMKIAGLRNIVLEEKHAAVLLALWKLRDIETRIVDTENVYEEYNKAMKAEGKECLSLSDFGIILGSLDDMHCVRLNENNTITLIEVIEGEF